MCPHSSPSPPQLDFVRSYAAQVQAAGGASPEGSSLSQSQIDALGEAVVGPRDAGLGERLAGDVCSVCLGEYLESDRVRVMPVRPSKDGRLLCDGGIWCAWGSTSNATAWGDVVTMVGLGLVSLSGVM